MYEKIVSYFCRARSFECTYLYVSMCMMQVGKIYPQKWIILYTNILLLTQVVMNNEQPSIAMSVAIRDDFTWVVGVQGRTFDAVTLPTSCRVWHTVVCSLTSFHNLLDLLRSISICPGIPDEKYHFIAQSRKGKFLDHSGKCMGSVYACVCTILLYVFGVSMIN